MTWSKWQIPEQNKLTKTTGFRFVRFGHTWIFSNKNSNDWLTEWSMWILISFFPEKTNPDSSNHIWHSKKNFLFVFGMTLLYHHHHHIFFSLTKCNLLFVEIPKKNDKNKTKQQKNDDVKEKKNKLCLFALFFVICFWFCLSSWSRKCF